MKKDSLVSVIIIFLNAEKFIREAIDSVLAQTYENWELLLVDDGSTDESTDIAQSYTFREPEKVRYLEHPSHQNQGKGASRNLGIHHAKGDYIAFLDADDIWLPHKLEQQVAILDNQPDAGMLYGDTLYWYSWTQNPEDYLRDFIPPLGIEPNTLFQPPQLLPLYLRGKAAVPCTCSIIIRRSVFNHIGGFENQFRGANNIYEDQAFYAKVSLNAPIYVTNICWDWYRQHPDASVAMADVLDQETGARLFFLNWLQEYVNEQGVKHPQISLALQRELWRLHYPDWLPTNGRLQYLVKWLKKWLLKVDERAAPPSIRRWLWKQE